MYTATSPVFPKPQETLCQELHRHDFRSPRRGSKLRRSAASDRLLPPAQEPPLGAHLITPRFAYEHHGVYVGRGMVVHYSAFAKHWHRGPVEEISLERFAQRYPVWVRPARAQRFQGTEIVRRARTRLGENRYGFFSNNCEHLSEWCVNGEHRSLQVEHFMARLRRISHALSYPLRVLQAQTT